MAATKDHKPKYDEQLVMVTDLKNESSIASVKNSWA
jgi:hypothetical protein